MAPKKSKMALGDFLSLGGGGTSNWADEMEDVVMPTAPGQFNPDSLPPFKRPQGGDRSDFGGRGDAYSDSRPPRADVPFPDAPPYTAFVGNMSFESSGDDVKDFFTADANLTVTSVRMVTDFGGKSKGFCYAEFPEADMLRAALALTGAQLGGRNIRISVAEPPKAGAEGRSAGDWTRSGPLPDMPGRGGGMPSNRGPPTPMDSGRDWGDARGSKFAPSAPSSPALGSGRPPMGGRAGGSFRDVSSGSNVSAAGEDRDWSGARGGRFTPSVPPTPSSSEKRPGFGNGMDRKSSDGEARDWRARASPASPALSESSSGVSAPVERKRLQLSARTAPSASGSDPASPAAATGSRPNIFGGAAPVDTAAREQALLDARIEKERAQAEERRIKAEADAAAASQAKKSSNPFGAAKPVDVSAREKEVEEKLRKEKEEVSSATKAMSEAKIAEEKSANPKKEWKRPQHPNAGLTNAQASAPQSGVAKQNSSGSTTQGDATKPGAPSQPRQILKNAGIRKEGFSYSNVARGAGSKPPTIPPASSSIVPDNVPVKSPEAPAAMADNSADAGAGVKRELGADSTTSDGTAAGDHMSQKKLADDSVTEA